MLNKSILCGDKSRNAHVDVAGVEVLDHEHRAGDALDGIEYLAKVAELKEKVLRKP